MTKWKCAYRWPGQTLSIGQYWLISKALCTSTWCGMCCHSHHALCHSPPVNPLVFGGNLLFWRCDSWHPILVRCSPVMGKTLTKGGSQARGTGRPWTGVAWLLADGWWGSTLPRTIWTTSGVTSAYWNLLMAPTDSPQSASWWKHWCAYLTAMPAVRGHSAC